MRNALMVVALLSAASVPRRSIHVLTYHGSRLTAPGGLIVPGLA